MTNPLGNDLIGRVVCGYRMIKEIGEGGMGKVYLGESAFLTEYKQQVAIKTLTPKSERQAALLKDLFIREANIQVQLKHPHIVSVTQFAIEQINDVEQHFLLLEYVPGYQHKGRRISNVSEAIRYETGPLPYQRALRMFVQALDAMDYAHNFKYRWEGEERIGIVHRDIKPANMLLVDPDTIKISDFGIVKVQQRRESATQKFTPGTSAYMPPEAILLPQQFGLKELDARSDIYALGISLYEMLCGQLPFTPDDTTNPDASIRRKQVEQMPLPPSIVNPGVPRPLDAVVMRALQKHPDQRYQSAVEFKQAIFELDASLQMGLRKLAHDYATRGFGAQSEAATMPINVVNAGVPTSVPTAQIEVLPTNVRAWTTPTATPQTIPPSEPKSSSSMKLLAAVALIAIAIAAAGIFMLPKWLGQTSANVAGGAATKTDPKTLEAPTGMVFVPGGSFMMGRNLSEQEKGVRIDNNGRKEGIFKFDYPAHAVEVQPFYLNKTEVSRREYAEFVRATQHEAPADWNGDEPPANTEEIPVTGVNYRDAVDYCNWLTEKRRDAFSYRLPTEAEWEFAARGPDAGQPGKPLNLYPWGDDWQPGNANTKEARLDHTQNVTANPQGASPFKVLNLAGNVYEWTATDFTHYPGSDQETPREKGYEGTYQVVRGGAFAYPKECAMTTTRVWAKPTDKGPKLGFRCAAEVKR
ncbi:MAG: SUMF1/EgtB/PvdO family nonheme iron enzyme [Acidobacteria bacterium]|nr:SUMF1/EgtB/PvdO family nonheme iron enzyme [Acidobacteriota bacterium]